MASKNMETYLELQRQAEMAEDLTSDRSRGAMLDAFTDDYELLEPAALPHGGFWKGKEEWTRMQGIMREHWQQQVVVDKMWDLPEDDLIILYTTMTWTANDDGQDHRVSRASSSCTSATRGSGRSRSSSTTPRLSWTRSTRRRGARTMTAQTDELTVAEIRERVGHPMIDGDGHLHRGPRGVRALRARARRRTLLRRPVRAWAHGPRRGAACCSPGRSSARSSTPAQAALLDHAREHLRLRRGDDARAPVRAPRRHRLRLLGRLPDLRDAPPARRRRRRPPRALPALQRDGRRGLRAVP